MHRAQDKLTGDTVAVKIVKSEAMEVEERLERAHRFCPKNVLIHRRGVAKSIDFGLCIPRTGKKHWK